jgi:hypothetical protein
MMAGKLSPKKKEERAYLDLLSGLCSFLPKGRMVQGESPDFVIRTGPRRLTGLEFTRWTGTQFLAGKAEQHFQPEFNLEQLMELIHAKEEKIRLYRKQKPDRIWLVIVVNGFRHSPAFNIFNKLQSWHLDTSFDTVLLLDTDRERMYTLKHR